MTAPLEGVVVADFSRVLAGPLATSTLADLGAEVVKVERPATGDDTRAWGPPWTETGSSYFACANRSKKSLELDLRDPDDLRVAEELVSRADVLVENFRTGTLDRLGLGYERARALNPGLVYCSVSGFGAGAGADLPGYDFVVQAVGGLMSITGDADGEPTKVGVALVDVLTGKDAVIGILAALADRERTGLGQHVEVNLLSSLLGGLANQASAYLATGVAPTRMGNQHPSIAPYETLRCRDGLIAVACGNDGQFVRLVKALALGALAEDERFATNPARVEHREALVAALEGVLGRHDAEHWQRVLTEADVPVGVVGDVGAGVRRAEELGLRPTVDLPAPHAAQVRHPITYSRSSVREPTPPPALGEHNDQVRRWLTDEMRRP
ncbi:CaiB/BaiF CoA transferase family protein [Nocardioides ungokensis]|uniref:CaiB/BaiF CoA transferase family protein n=1 Tax=Nocardioides ungokensis TaxID=1643322 RepID=UPI001FE71B2B|nr:CoA transferase [Nocardioides ungokensis]